MSKIKEIEIDGERIFLKKNKYLGWAVVNPSNRTLEKNGLSPISKKQSRLNSLIGGNWVRFIIWVLIIFFLIGSIVEYSNVIKIANDCLLNSQAFQITIP